MSATLRFLDTPADLASRPVRVFVGRKHRLLERDTVSLVPAELQALWSQIVGAVEPGDSGRSTTAWTSEGRVIIGVLPELCSRHNTPTRAYAMADLLAVGGKKDVGIVIALDEAEHAWAAAMAVGRAWPSYSAASTVRSPDVAVLLLANGRLPIPQKLEVLATARRNAAHWVDAPPNVLNTRELVQAAREVAQRVGAGLQVIEGTDLRDQGFGGLWGVGKASVNPPAMVILDHDIGSAGPSLGWVGKGIVYDTGGLSLKTKAGMPGMKTDMGGAAAVLAAFEAAARLGLRRRITAVLCIAENSVGPDATRPDDVLTLRSGKTVEVNNTDAEGRLVLADGLAWMVAERDPDIVIDCATLTGAQLVATGKKHAAIYTNHVSLEHQAVAVGKAMGDLVHPLPFAPEFFKKEFYSSVADMKNSVKDRANAQSSCAGQFLLNHIPGYGGQWMHVDLAGPATQGGRGTGFGVGLLLGLAGLT